MLLLLAVACVEPEPEAPADFLVTPGVETATVTGVAAGDPMTLYSPDDEKLITVLADDLGQAHFAYVPDEHLVVDSRDGMRVPLDGEVEWILPEGPRPYWRGHLQDIRFELAR